MVRLLVLDSDYKELIEQPKLGYIIDDGEIENHIMSHYESGYDGEDGFVHDRSSYEDFNEIDMVFE